MPRAGYCTLRFMQQLLQGEKIIQEQGSTPENPEVPNWPELAVRKVFPHAIRLPGVQDRLPDEWNGGLRTDKKFFWCTVVGQHPAWVKQLVDNCTRQRRLRAAARDMPRETINIRHDIARMLVDHEF